MATSCVEERDLFKASQSGSMATASLDDDTGDYILNGTKNYVVNSINSQLFLVYAQTRTKDVLGDANDSITAFLVEADAPGVSIEQRDETIGSQQLYQSSVKFTNVRVKPGKWFIELKHSSFSKFHSHCVHLFRGLAFHSRRRTHHSSNIFDRKAFPVRHNQCSSDEEHPRQLGGPLQKRRESFVKVRTLTLAH